jgi:hypothetical protein
MSNKYFDLEFFTDDPNLIKLCTEYWKVTEDGRFARTATEIAKEFGVSSSRLGKVVEGYCTAYSTEIFCENCGTPYFYDNRSAYQSTEHSQSKIWICDECQELERQNREKDQRKTLHEEFDLKIRQPIELSSLSLENAVYLLSLVRSCGSEDFSHVKPMSLAKEPFAPSKGFEINILNNLYHGHCIFIHPESPLDAFIFDDPIRFYPARVMWALPVDESGNPKNVIAALEEKFRTMDWNEEWEDEQLELWMKIAHEECIQYLTVCVTEHGFTFSPGDKTNLVIDSLLREYSVGQIYSFIWRASKDAAAFYLREKVTKLHAANTVVGNLQRQGERAKAEGWQVKPYGRDRRCPQSMISQVFFNTVLQIGEAGFTQKPYQAV